MEIKFSFALYWVILKEIYFFARFSRLYLILNFYIFLNTLFCFPSNPCLVAKGSRDLPSRTFSNVQKFTRKDGFVYLVPKSAILVSISIHTASICVSWTYLTRFYTRRLNSLLDFFNLVFFMIWQLSWLLSKVISLLSCWLNTNCSFVVKELTIHVTTPTIIAVNVCLLSITWSSLTLSKGCFKRNISWISWSLS